MGWARLDDGFHDHPKVDELSLAAIGLWTLCLTHAHRHRKTALLPGHVSLARVRKVAGKQAEALALELMAVGLWEPEDGLGGYVIHDFAEYLPKERDPDERREAGRKGGVKRWQGDSKLPPDDMADDMASDSSRASAPAFPSRPDPTPSENAVEGERPETLQSVPATSRAKCSKHPNGDTGESCPGCARVRERDDKAAERDELAAAEQRRKDRENCQTCEGMGFVLDDEHKPTKRKCDHLRRTG